MTVEISVQIVLKEEGTTGKVKVKDGVRGYGLVLLLYCLGNQMGALVSFSENWSFHSLKF